MNAIIKGLNFQPWIGNSFGKSKFGRLLLLGESHYIGDEEVGSDFTSAIIRDFLNKEELETKFFSTTGLLFDNKNSYTIWQNVAFANLIQNGLFDSKSQPSPEDRSSINSSFNLLLNNLNPDKVIVLSKRMWNSWLTAENGKFRKSMLSNGKKSTVWEYNYENGKCLAMGICHPSRIWGNAYKDWATIIKDFLEMKL